MRVQDIARPRTGMLRRTWLVFGASFLIYAFIGWVGAYVLQTYNRDGLARIAQAQGVFFSRDPHLAAIGFIWPPLPVLTDLPLVVLLKPIGAVLLAGPLMSAIYAAFALVQLSEILHRFGLPSFWRLAWVIAFGAHPLIIQNGVMGLSESPFLAFLLLSLNGFTMWENTRKPSGLVWAGVGAALAIYCRYEAVAWAAVVVIAIVWQLRLRSYKLLGHTVVGSVVGFVAPPLWALLLWIFVNWQIMGNPIYFLVGPGSTSTTPDTAQAVGSAHPFAFAQGSVAGSGILLVREIVDLAPLVLPVTVLLVICVFWRRRWSDLNYLALGWSILGFVFLIAFRGLLPPFSRYFFWIVPAGVIIAAACYRAVPSGRLRHGVALGTALLLLFPTLLLPFQAWSRISDPFPQRVVGALLLPREINDARQARGQLDEFVDVASYLNAQPPGTLTLVDASVAEPVVFFLKRPRDLVMSTDRDFLDILRSPIGRVDQVLVPFPSFDARGRSDVIKFYPNLYSGGESWARLVHEFPGPNAWRMYQVVQPEQQRSALPAK